MLAVTTSLVQSKMGVKGTRQNVFCLDMVADTCDLSAWETEAHGL